MPRPRKPTAILEMNGAYKKNPSRRRSREGEPRVKDPLGQAPDEWKERSAYSNKYIELVRIWGELQQQAPKGVLTFADRFHVETTCLLMYKIRHEKCSSGDYAQLNRYLGQMGLNPSDRTKVTGEGPEKKKDSGSSWAELVG